MIKLVGRHGRRDDVRVEGDDMPWGGVMQRGREWHVGGTCKGAWGKGDAQGMDSVGNIT